MKDHNHYNVLIATPGRNMEAEYVKSLVNTLDYLHQNNISYLFLSEYSSQVNAAREATAMGSRYLDAFSTELVGGRVTYDKVIWIDSDISWQVDDFIKLYSSNLDIVSGIYFNEDGNPLVRFLEDIYHNPEMLKDKIHPFEVFAVGFGFIAMKSGVFENIPRPWFETLFQKIENEDGTKEMYIPYGEDFSWCKKAHKSGYKIYLDPSVRVGHHKKIRIFG